VAALIKESSDVRTLTKQTAKAVAEQGDAVAALASTATRQTEALQTVARSIGEQRKASEQLVEAVTDVRSRSRELHKAIAQQVEVAGTVAGDLGSVVVEMSEIRQANVSQAEAVADLSSMLARLEGARPARRRGTA
jgi:methyl-accepting chemotaxis protein